jgi:hypothetical protein
MTSPHVQNPAGIVAVALIEAFVSPVAISRLKHGYVRKVARQKKIQLNTVPRTKLSSPSRSARVSLANSQNLPKHNWNTPALKIEWILHSLNSPFGDSTGTHTWAGYLKHRFLDNSDQRLAIDIEYYL